ncbi:cell division control protein Cdc6 [candidate division MSBL1 archaeon SCGC-AAA259E22]|uniref:ORC1-type DNA replication protein n=1 Tax=candidate division MSBL1 archaeon SCGC-AAA259E22 TaxID=1698265 RepID=A0A133UD98_9EURY|nr:cell division control protein Cdc6 [candidate division MSBL1 archaeon SCGC-AAA259E22]
MQKKSGGIFKELLENKQIFKDREYLRPSHIPENFPHRDEQVNRLARIWVAPLRGETPSNVFIYGKTGTGKTATVKYLMEELEHVAGDLSREVEVAYLNCEVVDTKYRILATLSNKIRETLVGEIDDVSDLPEKVPMTGWPTDEVYGTLLTLLDYRKQVIIVTLDEIDRLVSKGTSDVLYLLSRINSDLDNTKMGVVGISNNLNFVSDLDPRIVSSLGEEEVVFPPYDANQLEDILEERSEKGFADGVIEESVINLCAAHAARKHGDARKALDLLRNAGEIAEEEEAQKVTTDHVTRASRKIEHDRMEEAIKSLPDQSKLVLLSVLLLQERKARKIGTGDIYEVYSSLCRQHGWDVLTRRRVSGLISELDMMGVINARVVSNGRYGRTKEVELNVDPLQVRSAVQREIYIQDLDSLPLSKQKKLG